MRALLIDDDRRCGEMLTEGLRPEGLAVKIARDGYTGLHEAVTGDYDVIILDLLLPGISGYEVLRRLRMAHVWTPVVVLTAKDGEYDEADAFDLGADDFLRKPFSMVVLPARLRALWRRSAPPRPTQLRAGDLVLDPARRRVFRGGCEVRLTQREFAVLEFLMRHAGDVVSKSALLAAVWNEEYAGNVNTVELYVGYLRKKIDVPFGRSSIQTLRGSGYRLEDDAEPAPATG
ncbi:response regulator transcription factor [Amycolatopsis thermophila]|uniref:Two-component system OmpR family response regulator n=1 Tax=Amycolatopsis thermophila TaxID=206084 RepID=A0ABU0F804_9PSEU|nr:response regulator transcription factor [Amycolatopsis thermophila]MDQ0383170.1 two-component system OmpR family response regulator [Amycolatopsis thermophila]